MKCPKCGYLGFETTDRCRNCQYDFSLAPFTSEPELTLHGNDRKGESPADFELPPIKRQTDSLSATALDLDRLFGAPEPTVDRTPPAAPLVLDKQPNDAVAPHIAADTAAPPEPEPELVEAAVSEDEPVLFAASAEDVDPEPDPEPELLKSDELPLPVGGDVMASQGVEDDPPSPPAMAAAHDEAALPFDDVPLVPPPAARPPLAVRRSTPEVPRNRPRTTRPVKFDSLNLEPPAPSNTHSAQDATETIKSLMEPPTLGVRVGAGLIDVLLLVAIDAVVLYLTLRVTGLQNSLEDLRVLPPVPFVGFLALLTFGYVAAFTVAGGQTIGKMMLSLRVIGDDGRPVDAAGGVLRALGCMLVPLTLGLSYLPALFTSEHRALHDRLAGTRVVQE